MDLVCEGKPLLSWCRGEASQGADDTMARALRSGDGFDKKMVGVGLALDLLGCTLNEHE